MHDEQEKAAYLANSLDRDISTPSRRSHYRHSLFAMAHPHPHPASAHACLPVTRYLIVSLGIPFPATLGPTKSPFLASHASQMQPMTSSVPVPTAWLRIGSRLASDNIAVVRLRPEDELE